MTDFSKHRIDELCEFTNGFAFKSGDYIEKSEETIEVFRMGYIARSGGFKEDSTPVFIPKDYGRDLSKYLLRKDDILIAMTDMKNNVAILANTARIKDEDRFVLNQRVGCLRVKDKKLLDPTFLYFYTNGKPHVEYLRSRANSGVQVNLSTSSIKEAEILIPPLTEQKAIASVLGALDDKIENNRQMNETLEEMARAIFKSWFVDFDPVHAKAAGNAPVHIDAETAELFPSSFGDDGLPEGWDEEALYNIATFINGAAYKNMHFCDQKDGLPVIKIIELKNGISAQTKFTNTDLGEKYKVTAGEIFFAWSGSPQTSINTFIWPYGDGWLNQHIFAIKENGFGNLAYIYFQMKVLNPKFIEIARDKQTTGLGHVTVRDMKEMLVISAPKKIKKQFEQIAAPLFEKIKLNLSESQTLTDLRDTLLPKLMSGEIRVADAEREMEKAV
jgi:type I restriction enzyme, S subunit